MRADQILADVVLANDLVRMQFPQWADLAISQENSTGTDNAIFRLGDDLLVKFPLRASAIGQITKDFYWLPRLAPHVTLEIPVPIAKGEPCSSYPWHWGVYRWIEGEVATTARPISSHGFAEDLARFIVGLREIPFDGTTIPIDNMMRGEPLLRRDSVTRKSIAALHDELDASAAIRLWENCLCTPIWHQPPEWVHGDLLPGNLLLRNGYLCAVIDFDSARVGDPAVDLMPAWTNFFTDERSTFRNATKVDDATWARGRGWALSWAVVALAYYRNTNSGLSVVARHALRETLSDCE